MPVRWPAATLQGFYEGAIMTGEAAATKISALLKASAPVRRSSVRA